MMKIAISSQGPTLEAAVDPRFGRARYFIVTDPETGIFEAVDNTANLNAVQGAGIQAAQRVADLGVEAVVTGHVGPKAFRTLWVANIAVYTGAHGSVADAVASFKSGKLPVAAGADVEGHWVQE
jgi:predicted Fe-Mo cluster-binding NifX family protein